MDFFPLLEGDLLGDHCLYEQIMRQIVLLFFLISLLLVIEIISGIMIKRFYQLISYLLQDKTNKTSINLLLFLDNSFITINSKRERKYSINETKVLSMLWFKSFYYGQFKWKESKEN